MKQTVASQTVAHLWAHQRQNELTESQINKYGNGFKTSSGNCYSDGTKIFSYGRHFCMAELYPDKGTVLITNRTYSNTTAGHISEVKAATSHLTRIYVAYPDRPISDDNFSRFDAELKELSKNLAKAKKPELWIGKLISALDNLEAFINFMVEIKGGVEYGGLNRFRDLLNSYDKETLLVTAKEAAAKIKEKMKLEYSKYSSIMSIYWNYWSTPTNILTSEQKADIVNEFNSVPQNIKAEYTAKHGHGLRVSLDGLSIETSLYVTVPIDEARIGYLMWKSGRLNGFKFAGYSVTQSDKNGFKAGCHTLKAETINKIALQLNWK